MKLLGVLLIALLAQQPRPATTTSVRGVVVNLGTSEPVAKAVVQLNGEGIREPLAMATGADGRFEFRNVPGDYQLTASRSGYLDTAFGQRGPSGNGTDLKIKAGPTVDDIRLLMTATGAILSRLGQGCVWRRTQRHRDSERLLCRSITRGQRIRSLHWPWK